LSKNLSLAGKLDEWFFRGILYGIGLVGTAHVWPTGKKVNIPKPDCVIREPIAVLSGEFPFKSQLVCTVVPPP
jgi:hypothetical protein